MHWNLSFARSTIALLLLTMPLQGCVLEQLLVGLRSSGGTSFVCQPELPPPPDSVVDALSDAATRDRSAGEWTVDLEKHYQMQDAARPKCRGKK